MDAGRAVRFSVWRAFGMLMCAVDMYTCMNYACRGMCVCNGVWSRHKTSGIIARFAAAACDDHWVGLDVYLFV